MQFVRTRDLAVTDAQKAELSYWSASANLALGEISAAIRDFETFLSFPPELVSPELRAEFDARYLAIITPMPTPTP
jgi:hypothetical protein